MNKFITVSKSIFADTPEEESERVYFLFIIDYNFILFKNRLF
jgi:hypothetical protein